MSNRTRSNSNGKLAAVLILLGLSVVGLLAIYVKTTPPPPIREASPAAVRPAPVEPVERQYNVYDPDRAWAPVAVSLSSGQDPVSATVNEFAKRAYPAADVRLL